MPVLLDFESRTRGDQCDLKRVGGRLYWEHPTTEALCCVLFDTDTQEVGLWQPGDPCPIASDVVLGAHNAMGFDRFAAARLGWRALDAGPEWIDTSELARTAGLPGALDALAKRWLGSEKDKVGSAYVKSLSRPSRARARLGELPPVDASRVARYCASDVEVLAHGWPLLESWQGLEPGVCAAERAVNDRGIAFDRQLAARLLEEDARNTDIVLEGCALALGGNWTAEALSAVVASNPLFCEYTGAPDMTKETVAAILDGAAWAGPRVGAIHFARARQAIASIARGKLEAGLARCSADGRLRDTHRYYGAHTGRWSGRGMQLQNMPRPAKRFEEWKDTEICELADRVLGGGHADADEIDLLMRACLVARSGDALIVSDFAGVEARGTAWCAGDQAALDVFASGRDPYKVMAATIFGCAYEDIGKDERRGVGKIAELACGYGMGRDKFEWTANKALTAEGKGTLESIGVSAADVVYAWRDQHAPIVAFWRELENAFADAVCGTPAHASCFHCEPSADASDVAVFLPSGRPIVYNETRMGRDDVGRPRLMFAGTKGPEHTYGGKLTENVIQALCRDLMADALARAERAGLRPVLHVHDEIVCEVPESAAKEGLDALHGIMLELPTWAEGFPIGASGHTGKRYRK